MAYIDSYLKRMKNNVFFVEDHGVILMIKKNSDGFKCSCGLEYCIHIEAVLETIKKKNKKKLTV